MAKKDDTNKIIIFSTEDEKVSVDVLLEDAASSKTKKKKKAEL